MMHKLSRSTRALMGAGALAVASFAIAMPALAETDDGVEVLVGIPTSTSNTTAPATTATAGGTNTSGTGSNGSTAGNATGGNTGTSQLATTGTEEFLAIGLSASAITLAGTVTLLSRRRLGGE